jgi:hypothetical protein
MRSWSAPTSLGYRLNRQNVARRQSDHTPLLHKLYNLAGWLPTSERSEGLCPRRRAGVSPQLIQAKRKPVGRASRRLLSPRRDPVCRVRNPPHSGGPPRRFRRQPPRRLGVVGPPLLERLVVASLIALPTTGMFPVTSGVSGSSPAASWSSSSGFPSSSVSTTTGRSMLRPRTAGRKISAVRGSGMPDPYPMRPAPCHS